MSGRTETQLEEHRLPWPMIPPEAKRLDAVLIYRKCLLTRSPRWSGWKQLNEEIIERWSVAGLRYVKERAWRGD